MGKFRVAEGHVEDQDCEHPERTEAAVEARWETVLATFGLERPWHGRLSMQFVRGYRGMLLILDAAHENHVLRAWTWRVLDGGDQQELGAGVVSERLGLRQAAACAERFAASWHPSAGFYR